MGFVIDPERIYHESELLKIGIEDGDLRRGRQSGELKFKEVRRGQRYYRGRAVLDWLSPEGVVAS